MTAGVRLVSKSTILTKACSRSRATALAKPQTVPPSGAQAPSAEYPCNPPMRVAHTRKVFSGSAFMMLNRLYRRSSSPACQSLMLISASLGSTSKAGRKYTPAIGPSSNQPFSFAPISSEFSRADRRSTSTLRSISIWASASAVLVLLATTSTRWPCPNSTPVGMHNSRRGRRAGTGARRTMLVGSRLGGAACAVVTGSSAFRTASLRAFSSTSTNAITLASVLYSERRKSSRRGISKCSRMDANSSACLTVSMPRSASRSRFRSSTSKG